MMADDTKKTIEVEILGDAKKLREQLRSAAKDSKDFNNTVKNLQKSGIKDEKVLQKISKDFIKYNKAEAKQAIKAEKQLNDLMRKKADILRSMHKQGKGNTAEFKKEQAELQKTAKLYASIKQDRTAISGGAKPGLFSKMNMAGGSMLLGAGGLALGAVVGVLSSRISDAIEAAGEYNTAAIETLADKAFNKEARQRAQQAGGLAGYSNIDTMKQAAAIARQTGSASDVGTALQFSRAGMLSNQEAINFMGVQARGGVSSEKSKKDLEKIMAAGVASGLKKGRFGEFLSGVSKLAEAAQSRASGNVSGRGYAELLARFGMTGKSGLQGQRGANVLQQLEQGFMNPGGGEAGQSLVLRSLGFGTPSGTTSYFDALTQQQRGFAGAKGASNLKKLVSQTGVETGGGEAQIYALNQLTGLSNDVLKEVVKVINTLGTDNKKMTDEIANLTKGELPLEEQVRDLLKDDIAKSLLLQNDISNRLVEQGKELLPEALEIKKAVDDVTAALLRIMTPILKDIYKVLKDTYDWFTKPSVEEVRAEALANTAQEAQNLRDQFKGNDEGLLKSVTSAIKKDQEALNWMNMSGKIGSNDAIRTQMHLSAMNQIKEESSYRLGENKRKTDDETFKEVMGMSVAEMQNQMVRALERAVRAGVAGQTVTPTVNVAAPVVKNYVYSDNTQISYR